jgi:pyridoxamine 5'-phosphate oxidase
MSQTPSFTFQNPIGHPSCLWMFRSKRLSRSFVALITTQGFFRIAFGFTAATTTTTTFGRIIVHQNRLAKVRAAVLGVQRMMSSSATASEHSSAEEPAAVGLQDIAARTTGQQEEETVAVAPMSSSSSSIPDRRSWKSRLDESIAKSRKIRGGNFVQLATVDDLTHEPRCRTVVFRGFQQNLPEALAVRITNTGSGGDDSSSSCVMKMITDARSNKVVRESASASKCAEIVWWFGKTNEQYRIRGELVYVGSGAEAAAADTGDHDALLLARARKEQWGNLSEKAREQFYWPEPGLTYSDEDESHVAVPFVGGRDAAGVVLPPPPTFLLVLLRPRRCEYLRLTDNYRQIDELVIATATVGGTAGDNVLWTMQRVNP